MRGKDIFISKFADMCGIRQFWWQPLSSVWNGSPVVTVAFYPPFNYHAPASSRERKANLKVHRKPLNNGTSIEWKWAARYSHRDRSTVVVRRALQRDELSQQTVFTWPQISPPNGKWRTAMGSRRVVSDPLFPERHETIASSVPHIVYRSIKGPFRSLSCQMPSHSNRVPFYPACVLRQPACPLWLANFWR